jgi:NAD+ synthase
MERVYGKLVRGIKGYFKKAGFRKAVIGVSGGIDSALSLKLAADAIGKKNVLALFMPEKGTKKEDAKDTADLCKKLGVNRKVVEIDKILSLFGNKNRTAWINLKPRIRMLILYYHANSNNALVIGTSNRTELKLGYFTKYGDGGCDIEVIGDLYKTEVWELARFLKLPKEIINKTASAGLFKGQSDEEEIGERYKDIDRMLQGKKKKSKRIQDIIERNRHKTETIPIIRVH